MTKDLNDLKASFVERTKCHIQLVNKFAKKFGKEFPNHDSSKLNLLLDSYCYFMVPKDELTTEEADALNLATLIHITSSAHHPEYWTGTNLSGFTRTNYTPNGLIDATDMPEESMLEMVCDWCAVSLEKGNTPMEWFQKVNGRRWLFTPEQQDFLRNTIKKAWEDE